MNEGNAVAALLQSGVPDNIKSIFAALWLLIGGGGIGGIWVIARAFRDWVEINRIEKAEHRMLMEDLWERHPNKKDDFYIAMGQPRHKKIFFKTT